MRRDGAAPLPAPRPTRFRPAERQQPDSAAAECTRSAVPLDSKGGAVASSIQPQPLNGSSAAAQPNDTANEQS